MEFEKISSIRVEDPHTWKDKIFLTLDIDWASDDIIQDTLTIVEKSQKKATWFFTHYSPLIETIDKNPNFEIGIHPNFNKILFDQDISNGKNSSEIISKLMNIFPLASCVRSHSMTQSSGILDLFKSYGLKYDCNHFIPFQSHIELKPWKHWNGMVKVPYNWEDDVLLMYPNIQKNWDFLHKNSFNVLDFHPIHIALNTSSLDHYNNTRSTHNKWNELIKNRENKFGIRNLFKELLEL